MEQRGKMAVADLLASIRRCLRRRMPFQLHLLTLIRPRDCGWPIAMQDESFRRVKLRFMNSCNFDYDLKVHVSSPQKLWNSRHLKICASLSLGLMFALAMERERFLCRIIMSRQLTDSPRCESD
jgi:hypothetical protein